MGKRIRKKRTKKSQARKISGVKKVNEPKVNANKWQPINRHQKPCFHCNLDVAPNARKCPHCGCFQNKWIRRLGGEISIKSISVFLSILAGSTTIVVAGFTIWDFVDEKLTINSLREQLEDANARYNSLYVENEIRQKENIKKIQKQENINVNSIRDFQRPDGTTYVVRRGRKNNTKYLNQLVDDGELTVREIGSPFGYTIKHSGVSGTGEGIVKKPVIASYQPHTEGNLITVENDLNDKLVGFKVSDEYSISEVLISQIAKSNKYKMEVTAIHPEARYYSGVTNRRVEFQLYGYFVKGDDNIELEK